MRSKHTEKAEIRSEHLHLIQVNIFIIPGTLTLLNENRKSNINGDMTLNQADLWAQDQTIAPKSYELSQNRFQWNTNFMSATLLEAATFTLTWIVN